MNRFGRIGAISFARKHRLSRAFSLKVHKSSSEFLGGCGGWGWWGRKGERGVREDWGGNGYYSLFCPNAQKKLFIPSPLDHACIT